jgi:ParB family chromosome partitioning protein
MSYFDEARGISTIIKMRNLTQSEMARSMGVSQSFIANKLRLLRFSDTQREMIIKSGLSERHARTLLRLKSDAEISSAIEKISAMGLNVRASEVLIDTMLPKKERVCDDYVIQDEKEIRAELENEIATALKRLARLGCRASQSVSFYKNKRYITICIEE